MTERVKVIVYVYGGVVQSVHASQFADVLVIDGDDAIDAGYAPEVGPADQWTPECDDDWRVGELNAKPLSDLSEAGDDGQADLLRVSLPAYVWRDIQQALEEARDSRFEERDHGGHHPELVEANDKAAQKFSAALTTLQDELTGANEFVAAARRSVL